jgi:hypothetical protein
VQSGHGAALTFSVSLAQGVEDVGHAALLLFALMASLYSLRSIRFGRVASFDSLRAYLCVPSVPLPQA